CSVSAFANRSTTSHTLTRSSVTGSQSLESSDGSSSRALPARDQKMPPRTSPSTEVLVARDSSSARPYGCSSHPNCWNQRTQNRVSLSKSPSCSDSTSSSAWLISVNAVRTVMSDPSGSTTFEWREK